MNSVRSHYLRRPAGRSLAGMLLFLACIGVLAASRVPDARAAGAPSVAAGFTITRFADTPAGLRTADDLTFLDGHLFLAYQNVTLSVGGGGDSTVVEYGLDGTAVNRWSIKDKIDGMAGDPLTHRVIVTLNEDARSHLATITPSAPSGQQVTYYTYSPDIHSPSAPTALHTGGGTDQVNVDSAGNILITGSHSLFTTGTGVFRAVLTPPSTSTGTGIATLSPTFSATNTAANGEGTGTLSLSLGDLDSAAMVPKDSPRFGGSYVIADQTALLLLFVNDIFNGTGLTAMKLKTGVDDLQWATSDGGTLYVANLTPNNVAKQGPSIYKITGPFVKNTVYASNDGIPDQVVTIDLNTGKETPFVHGLTTAKGLVYLNADGTRTQIALNGSPTATTSVAASPSAGAGTSKSNSSNTTLIVVIVVIAVVVLGGGGWWLWHRSGSAN